MVWALLSLIIGLSHTGVVMALLALKLISETVALAVLDHSLSLTVVLCIIGALFPSKKFRPDKKPDDRTDQP
jgi:beta-lactamase regulating signal transducer with metallopeptidase domain